MKNEIKNKVKKIFRFFGFKITKNFKIIPLFKKNTFKTDYTKKVLISYIVEPFVKKNNYSHSNFLECYSAAEIFNELGFSVDVIDWFYNIEIDYSKYEVIYGMGLPLEKSFSFNEKIIKRIFYATGCSSMYSNTETTLRLRGFYENHGEIFVNSSRIIEHSQHMQTLLSDKVILLGNNFVLDTYKMFDINNSDRYININAFFYDFYNVDISKKDFSVSKRHFLWFGGSGLLHKGLDLLIDIFSENQDIYLHICGALNNEKEFLNYYDSLLSKSKNIINHGFVDIRSEEFKEIVSLCSFVILPSVSEGGAVSVLNAIANGGLIPVITKSTGLDINDFGILIEKPELEFVKSAIDKALSIEDNILMKMSALAKEKIRNNYTYDKYKENLKFQISKIFYE